MLEHTSGVNFDSTAILDNACIEEGDSKPASDSKLDPKSDSKPEAIYTQLSLMMKQNEFDDDDSIADTFNVEEFLDMGQPEIQDEPDIAPQPITVPC
jgi:hypothetical protein